MCGRYVSPDQAAIERQWQLGRGESNPFGARYNVAPQQGNPRNYIPVIRMGEDGAPELVRLQWWLLPHWSREARIKYQTFNARVETVATAASYRTPLKRSRCLIPAVGWYEWQELPTGNLPWYLHGAHGQLLAFAGLWDRWEGADEVIDSCSIVIGPANAKFMPIHERMPFLLEGERGEQWLDRKLTDVEKVMALLQPAPDEAVAFHRVSKRVNNARVEDPAMIEPEPDREAAPGSAQKGTADLF